MIRHESEAPGEPSTDANDTQDAAPQKTARPLARLDVRQARRWARGDDSMAYRAITEQIKVALDVSERYLWPDGPCILEDVLLVQAHRNGQPFRTALIDS